MKCWTQYSIVCQSCCRNLKKFAVSLRLTAIKNKERLINLFPVAVKDVVSDEWPVQYVNHAIELHTCTCMYN